MLLQVPPSSFVDAYCELQRIIPLSDYRYTADPRGGIINIDTDDVIMNKQQRRQFFMWKMRFVG